MKDGEWAALNDTDLLFMPLGPHLAASLGPKQAVIDLDVGQVRRVNEMQVRMAFECVMYRIGAFSNTQISQMRLDGPAAA